MGTTLFNLATNPKWGVVYASNSEANNLTCFEGAGEYGGSTGQGNLAQMRITAISGDTAYPRHLNYSKLAGKPGFDPSVKSHSLSTPTEMVVSRDGVKHDVAAFSSSKIGVYEC
ncbi:hypothetical protein [Myxococcus sp. AM009]|uniref:hypothetical protein n=1 Tax=Myxococcus sp. AM009 TaxID=2745137 RepID=UPI0020CD72CE|nr:hypothetical protein [Myxococcus sp. AM009]